MKKELYLNESKELLNEDYDCGENIRFILSDEFPKKEKRLMIISTTLAVNGIVLNLTAKQTERLIKFLNESKTKKREAKRKK